MIDIEKYDIGADEYGTINLYKEEYGEEICLGEVSEEGEYTNPWWMRETESLEELIKSILIQQYFGEKSAHIERDQDNWPERYVVFMNLNAIKRDTYSDFEKISEETEGATRIQGRYLNSDGVSMNGIYRNKIGDIMQSCVINEGKLLYTWKSPLCEDDNKENYNSLHISGRYDWCTSNSQALNYNFTIFKNFINEKIFIADFFCPSKKTLLNQIDELEKVGAAYLIYPHNENTEKFRVIASTKKALQDIVKIDRIKEQLKTIENKARESSEVWDVEKLDQFSKILNEIDGSKTIEIEEYDSQNKIIVGILMKYPTDFIFHTFMEVLK